ncbi:FKBP-type peptidyl-prolyl cis-trans isomerase [Chitinophaga sp. XS-30]|uniref:FKBP-type peptidyl-prolyl cis-trans isomerase n=1 Tax=Chitinophaga sp. XS-30 TaxID=2604421 RepID=UPI0011DDC768|nr:FKBP-type peptidyl-prolyl cis-trans isomerase [Chitinophaga sp. XS-30]QEH42361.1 FKBP-type peptidyl-prolyl cis-trans isomerase [Chitinophaga sp. XS-30]
MKKNNLLLVASLGLLAASCGTGGPRKTPGGIDYTIDVNGKGEKLKVGDTVLMHFTTYLNDSLLMDSRKERAGTPITVVIKKSEDKLDLMDGFVELSEGDSATFVLPVDSLPQMPMFAKKGDNMRIAFRVESKYSKAKQNAKEEKEIKEYISKNNLTTTTTPSGVYIAVTEEGTGEQPKNGDIVSVNYTGKLLDGTMFDSNQDTTLRPGMPLQPLTFPVGQGRVIPGWDEGIAQLKKGSKATLVIPSSLAYGVDGSPPMIQPNSVLVFTVELLDVKPAETPAN